MSSRLGTARPIVLICHRIVFISASERSGSTSDSLGQRRACRGSRHALAPPLPFGGWSASSSGTRSSSRWSWNFSKRQGRNAVNVKHQSQRAGVHQAVRQRTPLPRTEKTGAGLPAVHQGVEDRRLQPQLVAVRPGQGEHPGQVLDSFDPLLPGEAVAGRDERSRPRPR